MRTLLLLCALPLAAQSPTNLGFRLHALAPLGDLRSLTGDRIGFGLAGYLDLHPEETPNLVVRPVLQADYIPPKTALDPGGTSQSKAFATFLGAELLWRTTGNTEGAYLAAAMGFQSWRVTRDTGGLITRHLGTKLGLNAGVGYQFTQHLAFEARSFWSPVDEGLRASGVTGGVAWTF